MMPSKFRNFSTILILGIVPSILASCPSDLKWNYEGSHYWPEQCSTCSGDMQSPINIQVSDVLNEDLVAPLRFIDYEGTLNGDLENDGHVIKFTPDFDADTHKLSHAHLPNVYKLAQFHFHWGSTNDQGSEHSINGQAFPMEMHLVHYNEKFSSDTEALASNNDDALAVVSILFHVGKNSNSALDTLVDDINDTDEGSGNYDVDTPGDTEPATTDLGAFINQIGNAHYFYKGSLTTPSCNEQVLWIIMEDVISIDQTQMDAFRQYVNYKSGAPMVDNYRPTQPVNNRLIRRVEEKCQCEHPDAVCAGDATCYVFLPLPTGGAAWADANDACKALSLVLPSARTKVQNDALQNLIYKRDSGEAWLDLGDADTEGTYLHLSDDSEVTYFDWDDSEPSDTDSSQNCVATSGGNWADEDCTDSTIVGTIICQEPYLDLPSTPTPTPAPTPAPTTTPTPTDFSGYNLLVLGGDPTDDSNVAAVLNKESNCNDLPNLTLDISRAVGALMMDNTPVFCGGQRTPGNSRSDICFKYDSTTTSWVGLANLNTGRAFASAALLDSDTLWVTGGHKGTDLSSTELVDLDGTVTQGPELAQPVRAHCVISYITTDLIGDRRLILTGGRRQDEGTLSDTVIYKTDGSNVVSVGNGPPMNSKRELHGCTTFINSAGNEIALVVGGNSPGTKAEILDTSASPVVWKTITDLPVSMPFSPGALRSPDDDGVILVYDSSVVHLKEDNGVFTYETLTVDPAKPRTYATAMFIPTSMTTCT